MDSHLHHRHLEIHQDDRKIFARIPVAIGDVIFRLGEEVKAFQPVVGNRGRTAKFGYLGRQDSLVDEVVLDLRFFVSEASVY